MSQTGRVVVLTTGGTIASAFDVTKGSVSTSLSVTDLLSRLKVENLPQVEGRNILAKNSASLSLDDAELIVNAIVIERARADVIGIVVTHGTDTLEETAFLADLMLAPGKPVVFTGAQAAADEQDRDGPRNLADAIRVAASTQAQSLGVLITFDGDVLSARDATKMHSARRYTFGSSNGPLGAVDQDIVRLTRRPASYPRFDLVAPARPVDLITLTLGGGERLVRLIADNPPKGLVLSATGRGNATPVIVDIVAELTAKKIPVLITSRSPEGRVAPIYGQGGGADLKRAGAIFCGDLSGPKARLLLAVILGQKNISDIAAQVASVVDATLI
ncbi:MAG: asparaginase [Parvibaculum sp.]|nr:asparaginase [Parvibaculum sp.]